MMYQNWILTEGNVMVHVILTVCPDDLVPQQLQPRLALTLDRIRIIWERVDGVEIAHEQKKQLKYRGVCRHTTDFLSIEQHLP